MKPCTVEFQAFGPYAGHELVDFEKLAARGLFLICGKTGTGKTMILDAITFALYGKSSGHGRDDFEAMRCTNAAFDVTTYVRFTFENNGIYYRFERRLERKRKNLSASYMVWQKDENGTWTALFENAKEKMLNEKAEEIIGLSYEQFRQVIVLPQGQFEKFLTSDSADKEKILTSIFGEEKWQAVAQLMFEEATERRQQLKSLQEELGRQQEPDEEACKTELARLEKLQETYAKETAVLSETIRRLSQKAEKLALAGEGLEEKLLEAEQDLAFAKKLRGDAGTGLQRYVLGILFSSVIAAANRMLSMVHGGRYRLFRSDEKAQGSNKRGLELKVYDKNSEEHEGRFVSTLSGGEKFLASLALSIGMSTIAQKSGIRIEALFIDEGFGSLDEDSITDAMQILGSIQQANGLVGIISHVQLLQERIPTKLRVEETEKGSHIIQTIG